MSKVIRDQLVTVQRMIDNAFIADPRHLDDFRKLAALAETQLHLVRTIQATNAVPVETVQPREPDFDEARLFGLLANVGLVLWDREDWCCPACEGDRFRLDGAPKPDVARPSGDKRYIRADLTADCQECGFSSSVAMAAVSWHRERAGLEPHPEVAQYRDGLT